MPLDCGTGTRSKGPANGRRTGNFGNKTFFGISLEKSSKTIQTLTQSVKASFSALDTLSAKLFPPVFTAFCQPLFFQFNFAIVLIYVFSDE